MPDTETDTLEDSVIESIQALTYLSVQTEEEAAATPPTNTGANILYATSSRRQGNFSVFYTLAQGQLAKDCNRVGITLDSANTLAAYSYLIQFYYERKFKDWNAKRIGSGDDNIEKDSSGAWAAYQDILVSFKTVDTTILTHSDSTNYPADWRDTQLILPTIDTINP